MYCVKCGKAIAESADFCTNCGNPTNTAPEPMNAIANSSPLGLFLLAWKRYFDYSSRATRQEYWYFVLFNIIAMILLEILDKLIALPIDVLSWIYFLAALGPSSSVTVRRLHDIGKSGWWLLIGLVPVVGAIILLIAFVKKSEEGENAYGYPT